MGKVKCKRRRPSPNDTVMERFMHYAVVRNGCWWWKGTKEKKTRRCILSLGNGNRLTAHKAAYNLFVGDIDRGKHIKHTCGNWFCVNPDHLVKTEEE